MGDLLHWKHRALEAEARLAAIAAAVEAAGGADAVRALARWQSIPPSVAAILRAAAAVVGDAPAPADVEAT